MEETTARASDGVELPGDAPASEVEEPEHLVHGKIPADNGGGSALDRLPSFKAQLPSNKSPHSPSMGTVGATSSKAAGKLHCALQSGARSVALGACALHTDTMPCHAARPGTWGATRCCPDGIVMRAYDSVYLLVSAPSSCLYRCNPATASGGQHHLCCTLGASPSWHGCSLAEASSNAQRWGPVPWYKRNRHTFCGAREGVVAIRKAQGTNCEGAGEVHVAMACTTRMWQMHY
jgi:hypothetical protein